MNYRHAFHAGNFADCMKHALLVWLVRALQRKPAAIGVLDTHAGTGLYDLSGGPAERTGEWRSGIARLLDTPPGPLDDYVGLVRAAGLANAASLTNAASLADGAAPADGTALADGNRLYPGSPGLFRALLRPSDRLACCELHPEDHALLRREFGHDPRIAVHLRDGYEALRALLPPAQKRGLVLIDPPYEAVDEFERVATGLHAAAARFANGVCAAWYPVKHRAPVRAFHQRLRDGGLRDVVAVELWMREPLDAGRLNGCGLVVLNPPFRFEQEAPALLDALLRRLGGREPGEGVSLVRLADE